MKQLMYFKLLNCPYCKEVDKWLEELMEENSEYKKIDIRIIDERKEPELSDSYDYYYVPTFFYDNKKLHEGVASKNKIKKTLEKVLAEME